MTSTGKSRAAVRSPYRCAALLIALWLPSCGGDGDSDSASSESAAAEVAAETEVSSMETKTSVSEDPADLATPGVPVVLMRTTEGDIRIELHPQEAPETVENFLQYVDDGHYDGTIFHRVIPGFVIQGGGMESGMREKTTQAPIENEADNGLKNLTGTICMARTNDPHSATSQFFINTKDNPPLDHRDRSLRGWGLSSSAFSASFW